MGLFTRHQPEHHAIDGRNFSCTVCNHDLFNKREAQLHSSTASFLNIEWTGPSVICLICDKCGYIHWFQPKK